MNYEVIEIRSRKGARTPKSDISTGVKATAGDDDCRELHSPGEE